MKTTLACLVLALISLCPLFMLYRSAVPEYTNACVKQTSQRLNTNKIVAIDRSLADAVFIVKDEFDEIHIISYYGKRFEDQLIFTKQPGL